MNINPKHTNVYYDDLFDMVHVIILLAFTMTDFTMRPLVFIIVRFMFCRCPENKLYVQ